MFTKGMLYAKKVDRSTKILSRYNNTRIYQVKTTNCYKVTNLSGVD